MNKNSFLAAIHGVIHIARSERHFRVHCFVALVVCAVAFFFHVSLIEWALIALAIAMVLILEGINAVVEALVDVLYPRFDVHAGRIKDMIAGCVLLAVVASIVIGLCIFVPHAFVAWQAL